MKTVVITNSLGRGDLVDEGKWEHSSLIKRQQLTYVSIIKSRDHL